MSWILSIEPPVDPPECGHTRGCDRYCDDHRHPDVVQEDLDDAIQAARRAFPPGLVPSNDEVDSDVSTLRWAAKTRRDDSAYGIAQGWRDAWSCYETTAPVPSVDAFDAYIAACDAALDLFNEYHRSDELRDQVSRCGCDCHY